MRKIRAGLILGSVFLLSACSKAAQDETLRIGFPGFIQATRVNGSLRFVASKR